MGYKVIKDGVVLDAVLSPVFVRYHERLKKFVLCKRDVAEGIVSHDEEHVWILPGFIYGGYDSVEIAEISESDAQLIISALDEGKTPIIEEDDQEFDCNDEETVESIEFIRDYVIQTMKAECASRINSGCYVVLSSGIKKRFGCTVEDQMNLMVLKTNLSFYDDLVPYHADGEEFKYYSAEDIVCIFEHVERHVLFHRTYFNSLCTYIRSLNTIADLQTITYGIDIPAECRSDVFTDIASLEKLEG